MKSSRKQIGEVIAYTLLATLPIVGLAAAAASRGGFWQHPFSLSLRRK